MQIIEEVQLDFSDVLIKPRRSTIASRKDADITRSYKFKWAGYHPIGTGIMQANMGTIGNFEVSRKMLKNGLFACLHKHHNINDLVDFYDSLNYDGYDMRKCFLSIGLRDKEEGIAKLKAIEKIGYGCPPICIDVPNGYIPQVKDLVIEVRNLFPDAVIMIGNVVTGDITEDLILSGADIVKVGIGSGAQCMVFGTKVHTKKGIKNIQDIQIGDEVLTHTGKYKKVLNTMSYNFHHEKYNINNVECTPEHKFLVINKSDKEVVNEDNLMDYAYWEEACRLNEDTQLIVKRS